LIMKNPTNKGFFRKRALPTKGSSAKEPYQQRSCRKRRSLFHEELRILVVGLYFDRKGPYQQRVLPQKSPPNKGPLFSHKGPRNSLEYLWIMVVMLFVDKSCNTLQHTATHCNTLQHTALHQGYGSNALC